MKLKDLLEKYGEYEIDLKTVVGKSEIESVVIDLTKPKPKSVWELEKGDKHFWIDGLGHIWINEYIDLGARDIGNLFLDREEAHKEVERRKVEALLLKYGGRRYFDGHNHNYHIGLDKYEEHLKVYILMTPTQGTIYFDTKEQAKKAIQEIGEERIKEALFEVR